MLKKYLLDTFVPVGLRQWLRQQKGRVTHRLSPYEPHIVTRRRGEHEYKVYVADRMAEGWYAWGQPDVDYALQPELAFLQNHALQPGALVFDIGAHQCVVATLMAKIVGPTGTVVAVEATPRNVEIGLRNRTLNDLENLHILNAAISDTSGTIDFLPDNNGRVSTKGRMLATIQIETVTVDDLAAQYGTPNVLFIDVEGFELHALRGATHVLNAHPDCFIEVHTGCGLEDYGGSVEAILKLLEGHHYNLFIAAASSGNSHTFQPLLSEPLPTERFFLIAVARRA